MACGFFLSRGHREGSQGWDKGGTNSKAIQLCPTGSGCPPHPRAQAAPWPSPASVGETELPEGTGSPWVAAAAGWG